MGVDCARGAGARWRLRAGMTGDRQPAIPVRQLDGTVILVLAFPRTPGDGVLRSKMIKISLMGHVVDFRDA
jgi:hypothetical protein